MACIIGVRQWFDLLLLVSVLTSPTVAEEASAWRRVGHLAACASDISGGALAGGSIAAAAAALLGAPVASTLAGGLLLGSVAGGLHSDGCGSAELDAEKKEVPKGSAVKGAAPLLQHSGPVHQNITVAAKHNRASFARIKSGKVGDPRRERNLDALLQGFLPHKGLGAGNALGKDQHCNSHGLCMFRRYIHRWPNCKNLRCFSDLTLEEAQNVCLSHHACDGFSMSSRASGKERGSGCYKMSCKDESWNGFSEGQDDYWKKDMHSQSSTHNALIATGMLASGSHHDCDKHGSCLTKKYKSMWPNCKNLFCFTNVKLKDAKASCLAHRSCHGFSVSSGITDNSPGNGCYKTSCEVEDSNGYSRGHDDYWAKTPSQTTGSTQGTRRKISGSSRQIGFLAEKRSCSRDGVCMEKKYDRKWPNCINIYCFENIDLEDAKSTCMSHPTCHGFSMSEKAMGGGRGNGCYKTSCMNDSWNGYDHGMDGYWAKVHSATASSRQRQGAHHCDRKGSCMVKKYERKWPNCENLQCFSNIDLEDAKEACLAREHCHGFSISAMAMDGGRGDGCYKTRCKEDSWNGYAFGQDGYWEKASHTQVAEASQEAKEEKQLDILIKSRISSIRGSAKHAS